MNKAEDSAFNLGIMWGQMSALVLEQLQADQVDPRALGTVSALLEELGNVSPSFADHTSVLRVWHEGGDGGSGESES